MAYIHAESQTPPRLVFAANVTGDPPPPDEEGDPPPPGGGKIKPPTVNESADSDVAIKPPTATADSEDIPIIPPGS